MKNDDADQGALGAALWIPVLIFFGLSLGIFYGAGFRHAGINWSGRIGDVAFVLAAFLAATGLRVKRARLIIGTFCQSSIVSLSAMMLTYVAATAERPLVDDYLTRVDEFLGYDWRAYIGFVADHELLASAVGPAYLLIFALPLIVIVSLSVMGRTRALEKYILAGMISLIITAALFALFPATTAWTHLGVHNDDTIGLRNLLLPSQGWVNELLRVREGGLREIRDLQGHGLTAFPSFHCIAALLFVWATWSVGWLRIPMVILNACMILSTPIVGGHYLADLIGGIAVAITSILAAGLAHTRMREFVNSYQLALAVKEAS